VTIKLRNKAPCGCIKFELLMTQTCFCHFLAVSLFFVSLGKSSVVASWQSDVCLLFKLIKIFSDLLSIEAI